MVKIRRDPVIKKTWIEEGTTVGDTGDTGGTGPQGPAGPAGVDAELPQLNPGTVMGRGTLNGVGDPVELTLGANLQMVDKVVSAVVPDISGIVAYSPVRDPRMLVLFR